jgi:UDP-N-acetylmuramyl pentapeptide phosphotransferase/UDP-N-acetylglucosamine-1-phosphate transferase
MMIIIAVTIGMMYHLGLTSFFEHDYHTLIQLSVLMGSGMMMYIVGIADDLVSVGYKTKLLFQFIASCIIVLSGLWIKNYCGLFGFRAVPGLIGMPLSVLLIIYVVNAINFIDGIDGLASGLCLLSLGTLFYIASAEDRFLLMMIAGTAMGVLTVFWLYNVLGSREKCTKLFMGDCGSLTLGLILCFLIINLSDLETTGEHGVGKYLAIGFSTLLIPMLDVLRLVVWRLAHRRSPFMADNNHVHHLLIRCGLTQHLALVVLLLADVLFIALTMLMVNWLDITWVFIADIALWSVLMMTLCLILRRKERQTAL